MRKRIGTSTGLIKPCDYGRVIVNGIEYMVIYAWWQRPFLWIANKIQSILWYIGIAVYNPIAGECTKDFNCCANIGRKAWFRWHPKG